MPQPPISPEESLRAFRLALARAKCGALVEREIAATRASAAAAAIRRARAVGLDITEPGRDTGPPCRTDVEDVEWRDPADRNPNARKPRMVRGRRRIDVLRLMMVRGAPIGWHHVAAANLYRLDYEVGHEGSRPGRDLDVRRDPDPDHDPEAARLDRLARYRPATLHVWDVCAPALVYVVLGGRTVAQWAEQCHARPERLMRLLVAPAAAEGVVARPGALDRLAEFYDVSPDLDARAVDPMVA